MAKYLLISDLDETLIGDREALERFAVFYSESRSWLKLAYATGRLFESVLADVEKTPLPKPVAVIGGVGSEIRAFPSGTPVTKWWEKISERWDAAKIREVLGEEPDLELQPPECQTDYKVSYYFENATQRDLDRLVDNLDVAGLGVQCIYSSGRDLDFLPKGVDKGSAAAFLAAHLRYTPDQIIVSGNSGNDLALFAPGFRGIIVANAHDELKKLHEKPHVYLAKKEMADGVREGIQYWVSQRRAQQREES